MRLAGRLRAGTALAVGRGEPGWDGARRGYGTRGPRAAARMTGPLVVISLASDDGNKRLIRELVDEVWRPGASPELQRFFAEPVAAEIAVHREQLYVAFPDLRVTVEDLLAEGDRVVARLLLSGTHRGTLAGRRATGRSVTWRSVRFYHLADGKVEGTWAIQDRLGLFEQLGVVAPIAPVSWASGPPPTVSTDRPI